MARKTQLTSLVAQLRAETNRSQNVNIGVGELDNLKELLRRNQELLYEEHDWPHMEVERSISLAAGQRYYDFPSDLDYERIEEIAFKYAGAYVDLTRGISLKDYSKFDSNAATPERSSPAVKWDIRHTGTTEQFEIWPIPNEAGTVYLRGIKTLNPLVDETDRAELDDRLIVLFSAAELLARSNSGDAKAKAEQANKRMDKLKMTSMTQARTVRMGLGDDRGQRNKGTTVVVS